MKINMDNLPLVLYDLNEDEKISIENGKEVMEEVMKDLRKI